MPSAERHDQAEGGGGQQPPSLDAGGGLAAAAEATEAAGNEIHEVLLQGKEMLQQGATLWNHGAEVARDQWQHGAEVCTRGVEQGTSKWRQAAPYLDHGIRVTNLVGALLIVGFMVVGLLLIFTPMNPDARTHGSLDRMFWATQGIYLTAWSTPALLATVQCGVLRHSFAAWPASLKVDLWLSVLKFQLGRALFFIFAGFYVFPLLDNFGRVATLEPWMTGLSYFLGVTSLSAGLFLLIFDVVLAVCVQGSLYSTVPQQAEAP